MNNIKENIAIFPIIKFSFYENGTINDIYYPPKLDTFIWTSSKEIIDKLVPLLSKQLYSIKGSRRLSDSNNTTIKEYDINGNETILYDTEMKGIENGEIDFDSSNLNSQTQTIIDNDLGSITKVNSEGGANFNNNPNVTYDDYPIDDDSVLNSEDTRDFQDNNVKNDFNSLSTSFTSSIELINKEINPIITQRIFNLSEKIKLVYYNETIQNNQTLRLLRQLNLNEASIYHKNLSEIPRLRSKSQLRHLKLAEFEDPIEFTYPIFKTNLIGLKLLLSAVLSVDPGDGHLEVEIVLSAGKIELGLAVTNLPSKLEEGVKKSILVANNIINYVNKLTDKINSLMSSWLIKFTSFINEVSSVIDKVYDISTVYTAPMANLYLSIKEYSGAIFSSINTVIYKTNEQLSILTKNVEDSKLEVITEILQQIVIEYNSFINTMRESIEIFHNNGLTFINNINNELGSLETFSVDILYDIKDQIQRVKEIYETFSDSLFTSIENGINTFQDVINNKMKDIIGDSIEVVEFIGTALDQNEIMRLRVPDAEREEMINLLYTFGNKINFLLDTVFNKIKKTYQDTVTSAEQSSMKDEIVTKMDIKLKEFNLKSEIMLIDIKNKIESIKMFESYVKNIDIIKDISYIISNIRTDKYKEYFVNEYKEMKNYLSNEVIDEIKQEKKQYGNDVIN